MPIRIVQSKQNSRLKDLRRALAHPGRDASGLAGRDSRGLAGIEGPNLLEEALRAGLRVPTVFVAQGAEHLLEELALPAETEVLLLPTRHRQALLLSSRAPDGAALWLAVDLGIASFAEVAGALEISPQALSELWNRLPLEDLEIATRLGLDRQQVINLRCTARERLVRREKAGGRRSDGPITKVNRS